VEQFTHVGETLRRIRKERGTTLQELGAAAGLGRGQLSRIENGHQEATLSTLAKILNAQELSRSEFFRRYDLVEAEAVEVGRGSGGGAASAAQGAGESGAWPPAIQHVLSRLEAVARDTFNLAQPVARGAIEMGDVMILFRIVPRGAVPVTGGDLLADGEAAAPKARRRKTRRSGTRRKAKP